MIVFRSTRMGLQTVEAIRVAAVLFVLWGITNVSSDALATQDGDGLVAENADLIKLSDEFAFTEGPANDAEGNVFFTDQPNDRIMRWDARSDSIEEWMKPAGRSNGMWFDRAGNLLTCADGENQLWSISPDREVTVLCDNFESSRFNGPNDLWVDPEGHIYFTDPLYVRRYWERGPDSELDGEHVYRLNPESREVTRVATGFVKPNGIIGTPDGRKLYIADIGDSKTYQFAIDEEGNLGERTLFCEQGSDGMTLDEHGNVYLTGRGVSIFNSSGEKN